MRKNVAKAATLLHIISERSESKHNSIIDLCHLVEEMLDKKRYGFYARAMEADKQFMELGTCFLFPRKGVILLKEDDCFFIKSQ